MCIRSMKIWSVLLFLTLMLTIIVGCSGQTNGSKEVDNQPTTDYPIDEKILIYTSLYPLYDFAKTIGGDQVVVKSLLAPGVDAHDYEPTAKEMIALSDADLFFYNGAGFELWIEKLLNSIQSVSKVQSVNTTEKLLLLEHEEHEEQEEHEQHEDNEHHDAWYTELWYWLIGLFGFEHNHHEHGPNDPHVWLDPTLALKQAERILEELVLIKPEEREYFESNFEGLKEEIIKLDEAFQLALQDLEQRSFVVSHGAYSYLANRYNLNQIAITGIHPSSEPSNRELRKIIDFIKEADISHVFFEPTVSNKTAQVISDEVGATVLKLHPLENITVEEEINGEGYVSLMYRNLEQLLLALSNTQQ